ncbi:NAD(P)/FAD-dependent oxidoreductase [Modestobacter muralis]|uniref:NAD(P)/FAD-dependent oxidoreductase n=1 Tax=Modestobacter muralis TaxID=1608614 RepID=A0A6P0HAH8_9ACTN|nr:FAD/NAD(P)-binding oxidoreductase [Modestobacter muralis]NEK95151.1 NAD(P)/FAD-dependent oxidoreductase [Modestobacter muralis]NEN52039.1 NAD(P)/FAD-dependent oxidoreductase [Modestobacter muralis]
MPPTDTHHGVVIVGGGSAGISVAARLQHAGLDDVGLIDPTDTHYYQPLWTLAGGGRAPIAESARPQSSVMPKKVSWIKEAAEHIDPDQRSITLGSGRRVTYEHLVVCPGIQLDWDKVAGMAESLDSPAVSSNYTYGLAPRTWAQIRDLGRGTAIFTMPSGPIKCAGAPQKIAYLAADYWRQQGVLNDIRVVMVLPTPGMFGVPVFAAELSRVAADYGIEVRFNSELVEVDAEGRQAVIKDNAADTKESITYDFMHLVPPQSAPDWLKATKLADPGNPAGYVQVDKHTMQHTRYPEVFALGDAGSTPNSKTGAAIRKQAPVVAANLQAQMAGKPLPASYGGYASCPLTTARNKMLLAEFDYSMQPAPSFPVIDTTKERRDMWLLKRYGLPAMYWNLMLRGRA